MLVLSSASAGVPDEVAHAAEHVMDERPGEQKEHDAPEDADEDVRDRGVGVRPGGNRHEPPGEQDEAGRVRRARDAMRDRHHHRQHRPVNLQVRGKRPLSPNLALPMVVVQVFAQAIPSHNANRGGPEQSSLGRGKA